MVDIHLDAECTVSAQGGPCALMHYQRAFKDKDLKRFDWYADQESAYADAEKELASREDGSMLAYEYVSLIEPLFLLRTLWAMAATADSSTPPFDAWLESVNDHIGMGPFEVWKMEVSDAIKSEIFRRTPPKAEADG